MTAADETAADDYLIPGGGASITALPKISLHDHLDGGLRPATIIELAEAQGLALPRQTPGDLADWFNEEKDSLVEYLKTFDLTTAVMQSRENLARIAREFVQDLGADGVIYGEVRWAPEQHLVQGLTLDETVEAVQEGIEAGIDDVQAAGGDIRVSMPLDPSTSTSARSTVGSTTTPLPMTAVMWGYRIPLGTSWRAKVSPSTTIVWPALCPPW